MSHPQEYEITDQSTKSSPKALAKAPAKAPTKAPAPLPLSVPSEEDAELYDDVVLDGNGLVVEEMYDDVLTGGGDVEEELYDDVLTIAADNNDESLSDECYEDMTPGSFVDSYTNEDGELYVDVNESSTSLKNKMLEKSKMFKKSSISTGNSSVALSGNFGYKAPKKSKFEERWGVVEGNYLVIYKTSSDKRSQDKLPLGECQFDIGSTEAGAGKFAFSLSRGDKFYHISLRSKAELNKWVGALKGMVKKATGKYGCGNGEERQIYEATEDHIANSSGELTFKTGTLINLLEKKSTDMWFGQITDKSLKSEGKKGMFPISKVQIANEDLYY